MSTGHWLATVGGAGGAGAWKELGRTTLGSAGDVLDVGSLANKRYYMVIRHIKSDGNVAVYNRLNGDTGSNYSLRQMENGSGSSAARQSSAIYDSGGNAGQKFDITYIVNKTSLPKLAIGYQINAATGAANAPVSLESHWKWANSSNAITTVNTFNDSSQSGDIDAGSEVVVLGYDPSDSTGSNFWEELASVQLSGASDTLSSGTIAEKKYLWVQAYVEGTGSVAYNIRFNGASGSVYSMRYNVNGGAASGNITDGDSIFAMLSTGGSSSVGDPIFTNFFIVNNASTEKLVIGKSVGGTAGSANALNRMDIAGKWADTSDLIDQIDIVNDVGSADFTKSSFIKVWGHD